MGVQVMTNKQNLDEPFSYRQTIVKNSINDEETELAKKLSAVILYESVTEIDEQRVKLSGQIIPNPAASFPLPDKDLENIKASLFQ
jgi:hypothetical protein